MLLSRDDSATLLLCCMCALGVLGLGLVKVIDTANAFYVVGVEESPFPGKDFIHVKCDFVEPKKVIPSDRQDLVPRPTLACVNVTCAWRIQGLIFGLPFIKLS